MKLLLAFAFTLGLLAPIKASAATEYMLVYTNYNPYYTETVAGPFETSRECYAVMNQNSYRPGGMYSCNSIYVPG
jgi:hypothetical protein